MGGGGIFAIAAELTVQNSRITKNSAPAGGGIFNVSSEATISRSTVSGNSAEGGAGMYLTALGENRTTITASTISSNRAEVGGGVSATSSSSMNKPAVFVVNSTIAHNTATNYGGGFQAAGSAGVIMDDSTVAYNEADFEGGGGADETGGGLHQEDPATFRLDDSVLDENLVGGSESVYGRQCFGTYSGDAGNVIEAPSEGCGAAFLITKDARTGPLTDNGGPTKTVALLSGSPAIGLANTCPKRDQRGRLRPANCDSSAFENKPKRG